MNTCVLMDDWYIQQNYFNKIRALFWELGIGKRTGSVLSSDADLLCTVGQITQPPYDLVFSFGKWEKWVTPVSKDYCKG